MQLFVDKTERRISQGGSSEGGDNECDFFDHDSHRNEASANDATTHKLSSIKNGALSKPEDGAAPSVEAALSMSPTQAQESIGVRKPTIGQRKPAKKAGVSILITCAKSK